MASILINYIIPQLCVFPCPLRYFQRCAKSRLTSYPLFDTGINMHTYEYNDYCCLETELSSSLQKQTNFRFIMKITTCLENEKHTKWITDLKKHVIMLHAIINHVTDWWDNFSILSSPYALHTADKTNVIVILQIDWIKLVISRHTKTQSMLYCICYGVHLEPFH